MPESLIAAVLALPLEARRALMTQPGPGWWAQPDAHIWSVSSDRQRVEAAGRLIVDGWAWLPADSVSWLRAALPPDGAWGVDYSATEDGAETAWIEGPGVVLRLVSAPTAQECALRWWGVLS